MDGGGPFAQADFCGSEAGVFASAVDALLLILREAMNTSTIKRKILQATHELLSGVFFLLKSSRGCVWI